MDFVLPLGQDADTTILGGVLGKFWSNNCDPSRYTVWHGLEDTGDSRLSGTVIQPHTDLKTLHASMSLEGLVETIVKDRIRVVPLVRKLVFECELIYKFCTLISH